MNEADVWKTAASNLGTAPLDAGAPKPKAELLAAGDACAPRGKAVRRQAIELKLGPIRIKRIAFGRRWWKMTGNGPVMTEPEPFERMATDLSNAFGGPGFPENVHGKGADASARLKSGLPAELPRLELPGHAILSIYDTPTPAGIGPRPDDAPSRLRYAGTYDADWFAGSFPGLADDLDPRFFSTAPLDQQFGERFRGDESWQVAGMHPDHACLAGRLPGIRVRGFLQRGAKESPETVEMGMSCDTVWLFPNCLAGIMLWRGGIEVMDREAGDVAHVLLAYERMSDPMRDAAHYTGALAERTDPETALLTMPDERPLRPERSHVEIKAAENERAAYLDALQQRTEKEQDHAISSALAKSGIPDLPAGLRPSKPKIPRSLPIVTPGEIKRREFDMTALVKGAERLANDARADGDRALAAAKEEINGTFRKLRGKESLGFGRNAIPEADEASRRIDQVGEIVRAHMDRLAPAPFKPVTAEEAVPPMTRSSVPTRQQAPSAALEKARRRALGLRPDDDPFAQALSHLGRARDQARQNASRTDKKAPVPTDPVGRILSKLDSVEGKSAKQSEALSNARQSVRGDLEQWLKEVGSTLTAGQSPAELDEIDHAADKLQEVSEQVRALEADAKRASPARLSLSDDELAVEDAASFGAFVRELAQRESLTGRDLAGADLTGADFSGLDLSGVLLDGATLDGADLTGCNLDRAALTEASLQGAVLERTSLFKTNLSGANLSSARLAGTRLEEPLLYRTRFDQADFRDAQMRRCIVLECSLAGAALERAAILECSFVKSVLDGLRLDDASLSATAILKCGMSGFSALSACFERCALIAVEAEGADMSGAVFENSGCFGGSRLVGAHLTGIRAKRSGWRGVDLSRADLTGAFLDESDLGEAVLVGASLHRASLRRAVMHRAHASNCDFSAATLFGAQAQNADFSYSLFRNANLYSADLMDATLEFCDFTDANVTRTLLKKPVNA